MWAIGVQSQRNIINKQKTSSTGCSTTTTTSTTPTTPTTPTSSKLYNIQISQGDASLPDAKDITMPQLQSLTITDTDNKNGGAATSTKVTSIQGRNLTITKTETVVAPDTASISNMSSVSDSTGSFVSSSSASTVVGRSDPGPSSVASQPFTVSEDFGKDLVDNVRSRYNVHNI